MPNTETRLGYAPGFNSAGLGSREDREMSVFSWIRDLVGIRKDTVETKKAELEVRRLEGEELERNLIKRADLEDVKKYDTKVRKLTMKINKVETDEWRMLKLRQLRLVHFLLFLLGVLLGLALPLVWILIRKIL